MVPKSPICFRKTHLDPRVLEETLPACSRIPRRAVVRCHKLPVAELLVDLASLRYIIFSDQHKGARNGADDFLRCERAYNAALA